jgi:predicted hydrocarbon binding protein
MGNTTIKVSGKIVWETTPKLDKKFLCEIADNTVLSIVERLFESLDREQASSIVLNAAEKLGRQAFEEFVKSSVASEDAFDWAEKLTHYIFNPQGTGIVISEASAKKLVFHVFKCPTPARAGDMPHFACPFSYGYARGLWKKVFPEGEVLMGGTMAHGAPTCHFTFVTQATVEQRDMREKAKKYLTREEEMRML